MRGTKNEIRGIDSDDLGYMGYNRLVSREFVQRLIVHGSVAGTGRMKQVWIIGAGE